MKGGFFSMSRVINVFTPQLSHEDIVITIDFYGFDDKYDLDYDASCNIILTHDYELIADISISGSILDKLTRKYVAFIDFKDRIRNVSMNKDLFLTYNDFNVKFESQDDLLADESFYQSLDAHIKVGYSD